MIRGCRIAPVVIAASGKTSWMLKINRPPRSAVIRRPVSPSVSGGDIAITPSSRDRKPPAKSPRHATNALNATNPSARRKRFDFDFPGNG